MKYSERGVDRRNCCTSFFMRTMSQSVKQREKAYTFGERYTPCVRKM